MKKTVLAFLCMALAGSAAAQTPLQQSQADFCNDRFGIFLHWGIYSMFGQGEWYLNRGIEADEYAKAASGFYPAAFDAGEWADAFRDAGAGYVCFTSRHHDGFSMFGTKQSPYNIVDATPFGRDVLGELADSLASRNLALHLYYSHIDWTRPDYPRGRTGLETGVPPAPDWQHYRAFMDAQLTELLTNYGPVRCIWFDGKWDHDRDTVPFDWQLDTQYALIHRLQPGCMVANNHHEDPLPGEDMQIFERDVPGQNTAGYSTQAVSTRLPLETCQTMNGMWGYKVADTDYKTSAQLIRLLVATACKGANLLLNIGPQPDGRLPCTALDRLADIGLWMRANGETIRGTQGAPFEPQPWGSATVAGNRMYLHITNPAAAHSGAIVVPWEGRGLVAARHRRDGSRAKIHRHDGYLVVETGLTLDEPDHIIELELK